MPRNLFGRYLQHVLSESRVDAASRGVEMEVIPAEVCDIEEQGEGLLLHTSDGRFFAAERTILALGNLPGEYPIPRSLRFYEARAIRTFPGRLTR